MAEDRPRPFDDGTAGIVGIGAGGVDEEEGPRDHEDRRTATPSSSWSPSGRPAGEPDPPDRPLRLASLQLPRMPPAPCCPAAPASVAAPISSGPPAPAAASAPPPTTTTTVIRSLPTITLLVVADVDLASAARLSEYAIRNRIAADLCVACGPFCRDRDLAPYGGGGMAGAGVGSAAAGGGGRHSEGDRPGAPSSLPIRQRHRRAAAAAAAAKLLLSESPELGEPDEPAVESLLASSPSRTPLFRTREQTGALEGILTATLSQLENIVCRVAYCPGSTDPITVGYWSHRPGPALAAAAATTTPALPPRPRRLTPNSRNVNRQWLPVAPGLGAAALLHLDFGAPADDRGEAGEEDRGEDGDRGPLEGPPSSPPPFSHRDSLSEDEDDDRDCDSDCDQEEVEYDNHDLEDDDGEGEVLEANEDDEEEDAGEEEAALWVEQVQHLRQQSGGYRSKLERLLALPPPVQHPVRFAQPSQTILVTHYVDCRPSKRRPARADDDCRPGADDASEEGAEACADAAEEAGAEQAPASQPEIPLPWPADHGGFQRCALARERLCLEIASGSPGLEPRVFEAGGGESEAFGEGSTETSADRDGGKDAASPPKPDGRTTVLLPGSLRLRGEFSLVQVSLQEQGEPPEGGYQSPNLGGPDDADDDRAAPRSEATAGSAAGRAARNRSSSSSSAKAPEAATGTPPAAPANNAKRTFSWAVQNVDFHKLSDRKG